MLDLLAAPAARARHGAAADHARSRGRRRDGAARRSSCTRGSRSRPGPVPAIFETPQHPYTQALLAALPEHNVGRARLQGDSRRRARSARPAGRLPAVAALRLCAGALPARAAAAGRCRRARRRAATFALDATGRPTRGWRPEPRQLRAPAAMTTAAPLLEARIAGAPLPRVARTVAAEGPRARARRCFVHACARAKRWPWSANPAAASRRWRAR